MDNIKLYAVLDKDSDTISNVFLSDSDVSAGRFMVQNFKAIYKAKTPINFDRCLNLFFLFNF